MEAFRQVQGRVIQTDYESRIKAANTLDDLKTRRYVINLANQERDLRMKKLYHQIGNLCTTYGTTHHDDEVAANVSVPVSIDTTHAAKTLMDYVFVAPTPDSKPGNIKARSIPASGYLLDKLPAAVQ
jgi:hypothetical protein